MLVAGSLYAAIDTYLGPVYVAYGRTESFRQAIYFSLGWPFFGQSSFRH